MKRTEYPIHPDFRKWTKLNPPLSKTTIPMMQSLMGLLYKQERSTRDLRVERISIPSSDGTDIKALMYSPVGSEDTTPCLIYYHGGGFVLPAAPYHYKLAREYARRAMCRVLFVNYRLAPKHQFPAAPNDCYAAYLYVLQNYGYLGIDLSRIAVAGDSAGGNLAAGVCIRARDDGRIIPCGQMLLYPSTGPDFQTESMKKYTDTPMCNSRDADKYAKLYVPESADLQSPYLYPMRAGSLDGMPPAYVETAEFDCLHDDGVLYAERLIQSGVSAVLNNTKGTMHGFDIVLYSPIVRECADRRVDFLKNIFFKDAQ